MVDQRARQQVPAAYVPDRVRSARNENATESTQCLTRQSAKCYKSAFCVRPCRAQQGLPPYFGWQIGWVQRIGLPGSNRGNAKAKSLSCLEVGAF
jgi:hypothetical protein